MNAEIVAVGTELLMGQIVNTNARFISEKLNAIGVNVYYHSVVGDNGMRLESVLKIALERSDLVILTGGLGPTQDDLTKETVAKLFSKKLIKNKKAEDAIKAFFQKIQRPMPDNNLKQALIPEGSIIIENDHGTAPGCIIDEDSKMVVLLPGPPSEMEPMFQYGVLPYLLKKSDSKLVSRYLRVFGVGESMIEEKLLDLIDHQERVTIATYAKDGEVTIRLTAKDQSDEGAMKCILPIEAEVKKDYPRLFLLVRMNRWKR
jgi:nicotinamide-nucleotide amidase